MCKYCKSGNYVESTTTHVVDYKDHLIIVRNVPCMERDQCGDTYLSMEVARRLEEIISAVKKITQEISIVDYQKAA